MPLINQVGLIYKGGDIDPQLEKQIIQVFSLLDPKIEEFSRARRLIPTQVRILQPVHCCVLVGSEEIFVVLAVHDLGAAAVRNFVDWSGKQLNMPTAICLVERDLSFRNAFGIQFPRSILGSDAEHQDVAVGQIAKRYIDGEVAILDREKRLVKINPIFQGREFLLNEQLVFVLSPFQEPFDTIYQDHIKPTVESVSGLQCLRANDIYDNRPIMEDIWRCANEARLLVAELTGRNANVFYETGVAHTIGKEVILIAQSMDDVPFDLRHLRCVVYEYTPRGTATLEENLKNTVLNVLARRG